MDHSRIYFSLIARAQTRTRPQGYTESHHIVPRFAGGTDDPDNLVYLTYKEHFLVHLCLTKLYPGNAKAINAAWAVYVGHKLPFGIRKTRRIEWLERAWSSVRSAAMAGEKNHWYGKSFTHRPEARAKMSASRIGEKNHRYGKTFTFSPETKAKIAAAMTGKTASPETRAKRSASIKKYWEVRRAAA